MITSLVARLGCQVTLCHDMSRNVSATHYVNYCNILSQYVTRVAAYYAIWCALYGYMANPRGY
jgi:hypothetical protein